MASTYYQGRTAVITGAGSGIGRALALELAGRGARLALSDLRTEEVEATARQCRRNGAQEVCSHQLDVTSREAVFDYADTVSAALGGVDLVFCVAGVIISGGLLDSAAEDIDHVLDVNVRGVFYTAKAFLPQVIKAPNSHVVTVSSAFGLMAFPNFAAYSASKFAIRGLSDALRQEMALGGHPVAVTCVYPGGVRTPIVRNGRFAPGEDREAIINRFERTIARTDPEDAARSILTAVQRRRARALVGSDTRLVAVAVRLAGSRYVGVVPRLHRLRLLVSRFRNSSNPSRGE